MHSVNARRAASGTVAGQRGFKGMNIGPNWPLNRLLQLAMEQQPPRPVFNKRFKLLYATRTNDERAPTPIPVPRFIFFCNDDRLLTPDYRRYLEKAIRRENPFPGLPITIRLRGREKS